MSYLRYREDRKASKFGKHEPIDGLAAYRLRGDAVRARPQACRALSDFRHRENGRQPADTASVWEIPA